MFHQSYPNATLTPHSAPFPPAGVFYQSSPKLLLRFYIKAESFQASQLSVSQQPTSKEAKIVGSLRNNCSKNPHTLSPFFP